MHWLTLQWISEERVLTGEAAFDSQPSKGWFNKIRIGPSTVCISKLLRLYFACLFHCVVALLLLVGFSLRLEPLMADGGQIGLYLSSFILISHCIPPSHGSKCRRSSFYASSCKWFHEAKLCCCASSLWKIYLTKWYLGITRLDVCWQKWLHHFVPFWLIRSDAPPPPPPTQTGKTSTNKLHVYIN